jgi:hypothetical protein
MPWKIGLKVVLFAAALFGAFAAQPGIAKEPRAHHTATTGKNAKSGAKAANAKAGEGANAKAPSDSLDAGVTVLTPRAGNAADKIRNPVVNVKVAKPVNSQVRGVGMSTPIKPVVRNAIGAPVSEHVNAPAGANHFGVTAQLAGTPSAGLTIVRQPAHPIASATLADRGKIDGGHLIRPTVTSGLGGPAKSVTGINGTTMRPKY